MTLPPAVTDCGAGGVVIEGATGAGLTDKVAPVLVDGEGIDVTIGDFASATADAIQDAIRDLANEAGGPGAKHGFEAVYAALIGRARGPRAGAFIEILGPDKVADRFRRAAT